MEKLRENGIEVITGVLEKEALFMNRRFITFHQKKRPYIILKWAQSYDHKLAGTAGRRAPSTNEISFLLCACHVLRRWAGRRPGAASRETLNKAVTRRGVGRIPA